MVGARLCLDTAGGDQLFATHGITLVEAQPVRNTWLVTVCIQGLGIEPHRVAAPSLERAMRWATHWARLRHAVLEPRLQEVLSAAERPDRFLDGVDYCSGRRR